VKPLPASSTYSFWLGVVRFLTGVMWISHALPKFTKSDGFMPPNGFIVQYVTQGLQNTSGPYHAFLLDFVQPNITIFAELVRLGEMVTGVLLVLGLFSRVGGFLGVLLPLNYLAARGELLSSSALGSADFSILALSAINLFLPTGRSLGIDALLARRKPAPQSTVVHAEFVPEPPLTQPAAPAEAPSAQPGPPPTQVV
jgi:uncharacterized membrane protein YphA (DoxX/SURF4 family)